MDHWICFLGLLRVAFSLTNMPYYLPTKEASFDDALETCQLNGFLTDMAEEEESKKIILLIEDTINHAGTFHFWVGLRKAREECVLIDHPLKGFKWTVSNSSDTNVIKWKIAPTETCTGVLCGLLTVDYNGHNVTDWGWIGKGCKDNYPFICRTHKQANDIEPAKPKCVEPTILNVSKLLPVGNNTQILEVHCLSNDRFTLTCSPDTKEWKLGSESGDITEICLECHQGYTKNEMGSCIDIDECEKIPCESGCTNTQGSYTCTCDAAMGYVLSEDSTSCKKLQTHTDAPAASTTSPFLPLTHPPPQATNGEGSPPTLPPDPAPTTVSSGILRTSEAKSSIWIPVLVAVLVLVLVVITLIVVKCCLRKRSKKLSKEKGGKSKETVVLKAADSLEDINQKEIV